jgi:hypothetical protein
MKYSRLKKLICTYQKSFVQRTLLLIRTRVTARILEWSCTNRGGTESGMGEAGNVRSQGVHRANSQRTLFALN